MRKILFISTLLTFFFTSSIWAADISGTWVLKYTGNQGDERSYDMVIKADGENFTVSATHPSLGEMAGTGTLKGNEIAMTITATGEKKVGFELKGTVTGDKMAGTREVKVSEEAKEGAQGGEQGGSQRPARSDSSGSDKSGSQRPARSDSSASASGGAPGGAPSGAPASDSSKSKETSKNWTAEKKK